MARILLVEDYAPYREALAAKLKGQGHTVVQAATPHEAREKFDREAFDLLLLDNNLGVGLDGNDGIELTREFHAAKPSIPIIMITGDKTQQVEVLFAEAGGMACFSPMEKAILDFTINKALTTGSPNRPGSTPPGR